MYSALFAIVLVLVSIYILLPSPPLSTPSPPNPTYAGPILFGRVHHLDLSGLTIIPLTHLIPSIFTLQLPFHYYVRLEIQNTASELVFHTLKVGKAEVISRDVGRDAVRFKVAGVDTSLTGSFSTRVIMTLGRRGEANNRHVIFQQRWRGSGRISASLMQSSIDLSIRMRFGEVGPPRLTLDSCAVDEGRIESIRIDGYAPYGRIITAIPYKSLPTWPMNYIVTEMVKDMLESPEMVAVLSDIFEMLRDHVDVDSFAAIEDEDRNEALAIAASIGEAAVVYPCFALEGSMIGPVLFKNFIVPDSSPELYRRGGTREKMQAFNILTSEVKMDLFDSSLSRITFERSSLSLRAFEYDDRDGGELILTVKGLDLEVTSRFKIYAATSQFISWTTGLKKVGEKGTSTTLVTARTLELRFLLTPSLDPLSSTPYILSNASISPFTSITPSFTLSTLNFGAEILNSLTAQGSHQIAAAVSAVVAHFFKDVIRMRLQEGLETVEALLSEKGIELSGHLRGGGGEGN